MISLEARRTRIDWEPVADLASGRLRGYRATATAPDAVSAAAQTAQAIHAAVTMSALLRNGRFLVVSVPVAVIDSGEVAAALAFASGGIDRVVIELVGGEGVVFCPAARAMREAGATLAEAGDIVGGLRTWEDVALARARGADLGCGPLFGAPSAAFSELRRDLAARLRWAAGVGATAGAPAAA